MDDGPLRQELLPRAIQPDFVLSMHIISPLSNTYCLLQLPELGIHGEQSMQSNADEVLNRKCRVYASFAQMGEGKFK